MTFPFVGRSWKLSAGQSWNTEKHGKMKCANGPLLLQKLFWNSKRLLACLSVMACADTANLAFNICLHFQFAEFSLFWLEWYEGSAADNYMVQTHRSVCKHSLAHTVINVFIENWVFCNLWRSLTWMSQCLHVCLHLNICTQSSLSSHLTSLMLCCLCSSVRWIEMVQWLSSYSADYNLFKTASIKHQIGGCFSIKK